MVASRPSAKFKLYDYIYKRDKYGNSVCNLWLNQRSFLKEIKGKIKSIICKGGKENLKLYLDLPMEIIYISNVSFQIFCNNIGIYILFSIDRVS